MADVATRAGVSHQTVSRVVNGSPNVSPHTHARVVEAIEELGYRPNRLARALVTQRSGQIGVCVARLGYYGPSSMVTSIHTAAQKAGYGIQLAVLQDVTAKSVRGAIDHLVAEGAEAIALITPERTGLASVAGSQLTVPVVMLNASPAASTTTVSVDQAAGARLAVEHLISLGHRRIAHLAGPEGWAETTSRQQTWREVMTEAGLPTTARVVGDWSAADGYRLGAHIAEAGVTAVFSANDQMALGLLRSLAERGIRVPEDISVIGFDDIPEAGYLRPPLSTVRQDFDALGTAAIELLLEAMRGATPPRAIAVTPELILRGSTGPARE